MAPTRNPNNRSPRFERTIKDYLSMIYRFCRRFTENDEDAEDLRLEILIKVFVHFEEFVVVDNKKAWLRLIALRHCLDWKGSRASNDNAKTISLETPITSDGEVTLGDGLQGPSSNNTDAVSEYARQALLQKLLYPMENCPTDFGLTAEMIQLYRRYCLRDDAPETLAVTHGVKAVDVKKMLALVERQLRQQYIDLREAELAEDRSKNLAILRDRDLAIFHYRVRLDDAFEKVSATVANKLPLGATHGHLEIFNAYYSDASPPLSLTYAEIGPTTQVHDAIALIESSFYDQFEAPQYLELYAQVLRQGTEWLEVKRTNPKNPQLPLLRREIFLLDMAGIHIPGKGKRTPIPGKGKRTPKLEQEAVISTAGPQPVPQASTKDND